MNLQEDLFQACPPCFYYSLCRWSRHFALGQGTMGSVIELLCMSNRGIDANASDPIDNFQFNHGFWSLLAQGHRRIEISVQWVLDLETLS